MTSTRRPPTSDSSEPLLRHAVATLAYRARKAVAGAPEGFAGFRASETTRAPGEILAHLADLLDWALSMAKGETQWRASKPLPWSEGVEKFFRSLGAFDAYLASEGKLHASPEKLFQGPIADALTHVGQIALLRRMAGAPIRGENYFAADIEAGRVGLEQAAAKVEFD